MAGAPIIIGILAAVATLGLLAWLIILFAKAPLGYEDDRGFHIGEPKE